jgi:hypothetical protein
MGARDLLSREHGGRGHGAPPGDRIERGNEKENWMGGLGVGDVLVVADVLSDGGAELRGRDDVIVKVVVVRMERHACLKKLQTQCRASSSEVKFGGTFTARIVNAMASNCCTLGSISNRSRRVLFLKITS